MSPAHLILVKLAFVDYFPFPSPSYQEARERNIGSTHQNMHCLPPVRPGLAQCLDLVIELDRRGDLAPVTCLGQFPRCLQVFLVVRQGQQYQFDPGIRQVQA